MKQLEHMDLSFAVRRLPNLLKKIMMLPSMSGKVFVSGGFLRSVITNTEINDVDVFTSSKAVAEELANTYLRWAKGNNQFATNVQYNTPNAITCRYGDNPVVQFIHRWTFDKPEDVIASFDFTICSAVIYYSADKWYSDCHDNFYSDLAAKRLIYMFPTREEEAGGSLLRILKYYQKGFRIPLDDYAAVIVRMLRGVDWNKVSPRDEEQLKFVISGLLREVDPVTDPLHEAHLPNNIDEARDDRKEPDVNNEPAF